MACISAEKRVAKKLITLLGEKDTFLKDFWRVNGLYESPKKVAKPLEGLAGCINLFKEPTAVKAKKVAKPLEGLAGCINLFKEPKAKVVFPPLEGLAGSTHLFKEPRAAEKSTFLKDFRHIDTLFNDKKVAKPLEGLEGCMNLFPRTYTKKVRGH